MSYFIGINANEPIDGSIPMDAIERMGATFRVPNNGKDAEGFIQSKHGTALGIVWIPNNSRSTQDFRCKLESRRGLQGGKYMVREIPFGPHKLAIANILIPKPEIRWLADTMGGVLSSKWFIELTGWWDSFHDNEVNVPPAIIKYGESKLIMFSIGKIDQYFGDNTYDQRGTQFREKHSDVDLNSLCGLLFQEQFEGYGIDEGLRRMIQYKNTGLLHSNVFIHLDEKNCSLVATHLHHESVDNWKTVCGVDDRGNQIITVGQVITLQRLKDCWPYKIESLRDIEGGLLRKELARLSGGIERII